MTPSCPPDDICITCSDEALRVSVIEHQPGWALVVDAEGRQHEVLSELVEPLSIGDALLVHAGVAIARIATKGMKL